DSSEARRAEFSRDGRSLFTAAGGDRLCICDARTGRRQHVIKLKDPERPDADLWVGSMHLSADRTTLVALSNYQAKQEEGPKYEDILITGWDPVTCTQVFRRRSGYPDGYHHAVSADVRLLAATYPGDRERGIGAGPMRLEDMATGKLLMN